MFTENAKDNVKNKEERYKKEMWPNPPIRGI